MYPLICLAKQCFSTAHSAQTPGRHFTIPGTALSFALFSQLRTRFLLKLEKVSSIMLPLTTPNIWGLQYGASSRSSGRRSTSDRNAPGRGPRARPSEVWPFSPQRFRSQLPRTPRGRALGGLGALGGWGAVRGGLGGVAAIFGPLLSLLFAGSAPRGGSSPAGWAPARLPQRPPSLGMGDSDWRPGFRQCIAQGRQPPLRPTLGLLSNSPQLFPLRLLFRPRPMRRGLIATRPNFLYLPDLGFVLVFCGFFPL